MRLRSSSSATKRDPAGLLAVLTKQRLLELGRELSVALPTSAPKEVQIERLVRGAEPPMGTLLQFLTRDELKAACRASGLDDSGRARRELARRLLGPQASADTIPPPVFGAPRVHREVPDVGDVVTVRHRQWLVEEVVSPPLSADATRVALVCLDDDNQGRRLDVLWELELGARVATPDKQLAGASSLDPPRHFAAYLHALRWSSVTATDARLFQAPFRAGIQLLAHQLTPLKRALDLPRANLFIADDVGLGKTIEAGLVLQELILRQQVELVLIVAPAAVCLQWRDEMKRRFGLGFEIYNRAFVARRRQERGFGCNPWTTHNRFLISYQTLRRVEYIEPLLARLGARARKSLLVMDEAHTAAPASASRYAVDSGTTRVVRSLAPRFDHRLFLSATPHNGHSNSFSALLELLDPHRFTRGVKPSRQALDTVMVRRLKRDLRQLGVEGFPCRRVVQVDVGEPGSPEVELSRLLAEYTALMRPARGPGRLVFINLQKRLLSSIEAFHRTLELHAERVIGARTGPGARGEGGDAEPPLDDDVDDELGADEETIDAAQAAEVRRSSSSLEAPTGAALDLLTRMRGLAARHRATPDAKVCALLAWIREHQCPAVGGARGSAQARAWSDRKVLLFTEYAATKAFLVQVLSDAIASTDRGDERIETFHGGMSEDRREEIQRAFNGPPGEHPIRILIATDAAREGVNLQGHCADLFHLDIPWNPARMEQRVGRIDRTLQPEAEVRSHYFYYPHRAEDLVLRTLVSKVETIAGELGSLGEVVMQRLAGVLERGIDDRTAAGIEAALETGTLATAVEEELEGARDAAALRRDRDENDRIASSSRKVMDFDPALLRDVLDVGLTMAGAAEPLRPAQDEPTRRGRGEEEEDGAYQLPDLPDSWQPTLDTLRRPRARDESLWDWRNAAAPLPVVFLPPRTLTSQVAHLHLSHPLIQRVLQRFLAQGFAAHDLSRVTAVRDRTEHELRVVAFARLSLFGPGATRLHDELLQVVCEPAERGETLRPVGLKEAGRIEERLPRLLRDGAKGRPLAAAARRELLGRAAADAAAVWPLLRDDADSRAHTAEQKLRARAETEARGLRALILAQRQAIGRELQRRVQLALAFEPEEADQRRQEEQDRRHMEKRRGEIERELEDEPREIQRLYEVALRRLTPVGLVYLWPETRG